LLVAQGAYPRRKHLKGPPIGFALTLPSNSKTRLERVTKGNPSSLLELVISDEGKKFYNNDTRFRLFLGENIFYLVVKRREITKNTHLEYKANTPKPLPQFPKLLK
jgi:hypothetical protein